MRELGRFELRRTLASFLRSSMVALALSSLFVATQPKEIASWMAFPTLLTALAFLVLPLRGSVDRFDGTLALLRSLPFSRSEIALGRAAAFFAIQAGAVFASLIILIEAARWYEAPVSAVVLLYGGFGVVVVGFPVSLLLNALYTAVAPRVGVVCVGASFALAVPLMAFTRRVSWRSMIAEPLSSVVAAVGWVTVAWTIWAVFVALAVLAVGRAVQPRRTLQSHRLTGRYDPSGTWISDRVRAISLWVIPVVSLAAPSGAESQAPRLQHVWQSKSMRNAPMDARDPFVVDENGHVLLLGDPEEGGRIVLLDATGQPLVRVGREGSGPGEYRAPMPAYVDGSEFVVYDAALRRITRWSIDGSLIEIVPVTVPVVPSVHRAKEFLGLRLDSAGVAGVAWWQWGGDSTHDIATRLSPRFRELFPPARASPLFNKPLLGFAGDEVVLVDTRTINVTWWSRNGSLIREVSFAAPPQLPSESRVARVVRGIEAMRRRAGAAAISPNRLRASVASTAIPAVSDLSPARVDAEGRVWLLGIDGDSASAFVVGERRLLRRIAVSCPGFEGRWSLAGRWLAVACSADDDAIGSDAILKVFEIR